MLTSRRRRRSASPIKPRWQYWNKEPAPDLTEPMHFGPYRVGPYDATASAAPLELRHGRINKDECKWTCDYLLENFKLA